jgi:hypothetical protein
MAWVAALFAVGSGTACRREGMGELAELWWELTDSNLGWELAV